MRRTIALALEDRGHELVIGALLARIFTEHGESLEEWDYVVLCDRGGHASLSAASDYLLSCKKGAPFADLLVVASDANCKGFVEKRNEVQRMLGDYPGACALALPDPHIEQWLVLDVEAHKEGVGLARPIRPPVYKCDREYYKNVLNSCLESAGIIPQFPGGIEFAPKIVERLDFFSARKNTAFDEFYTSVKAGLRRT